MDKCKVWVGKLTREEATHQFDKALAQIDPPKSDVVRTVAIKINLCEYRRAESGATTDPQLLGALLDALHGRYPNACLNIIENDATSLEIWSAYRLLGIEEIARAHDAALHNVAEEDWISATVPNGRVFQELELPAILHQSDVYVNFTKLKTNALTKITGCLKNNFGLLRMKRKVQFHGRIDEVVLDVNRVVKSDICLVDGYIGMEGLGGPAFGRPKKCELLVAGANAVSVDACCARVMGFRPSSVKHIKLCHAAGLGRVDYDLATDIPDFDYRHYRFQFDYVEYYLRRLLRSRAGVA